MRHAAHILHDANSLLSLSDKLVLGLFNLLLGLGAELGLLLPSRRIGLAELEGGALGVGLDRVQGESGLFNILPGAGREHDVGVEGGVPAREEAALDLRVLRKTGLADALHGEGVLFEGGGQRVLARAGVVLVQGLARGKTGAGHGMAKGLGLGLGGRGRDESSLGLGGAGGRGEKADLFTDGAAEILESLLYVRGVVVGFVLILLAAIGGEKQDD